MGTYLENKKQPSAIPEEKNRDHNRQRSEKHVFGNSQMSDNGNFRKEVNGDPETNLELKSEPDVHLMWNERENSNLN